MARKRTGKGSKTAMKQAKTTALPTPSKSSEAAKHSHAFVEVPDTQVRLQNPAITTSMSTVQLVDIEQSFQIMQTMLHGCLSSIVFQRSIFPQDCYESRYYVNNSSQWTYKDYLGDQQGVIRGDAAGGTIVGLKKGISGRVDRFLSLMETGIFDALRRGFLKSLHLSIYEMHPSDILESWTLTVHYMDVPLGGRVPASLDLKEGHGATITLSQIKLSLNDFMRKITGLCFALPALPENKKIVLEIGYTNDRPQSYFAPGFPHPVYDLARYPSTDDWEKVTSDVALLYTGHHAASLKVSHLSRKNVNVNTALSSDMKCTKETGRLDDVTGDLAERAQAISESLVYSQASGLHDQSPRSVRADDPNLLLEPENTVSISLDLELPPAASGITRPSSVERQELQKIREMLRAPVVSNTQATQPALANPMNRSPTSAIKISQTKIDQVDKERNTILPPGKEHLQIRTVNEHADQMTIRCLCGHLSEEGHMVLCEFCESYQHLHCCGYLGKDDSRLPVLHVCYQCLFSEDEEQLGKVRDHCKHRRALWSLQNNASFASLKSYGKSLGYTDRETERLLKTFRTLGLVASSVGSSKRRMVPITLNQSESARRSMERQFFDPSFGIAGHLENPPVCDGEDGSTAVDSHKRTRGEAEEELPPAKRPLACASGAAFIDGKELHTPKSNRASPPILRQE